MLRRAVRRSRTAAMLVGCALLGITGGTTTFAAFNGQGSNAGNSVQAGSVSITDNDNGVAMMGFSSALPGTSDTSCITVTYNGSLSSNVRLYGTTGGTGLAQYMNLTVTRGTYSATPPAYDSCTNFVPDATNYTGAGTGVVYNGTLEGFADNYAAGLTDPTTAAQETWTSGESHVYRFQVSVQENVAAEGKTATQSFTWEARNL
jgi:predicted dehydrogenase